MNTADTEASPRELEAAGIPPKHADAIAHKNSCDITRATGRQRGPSAITILPTATVPGFVLLTGVSGHFLTDAAQERTAIRTAIEANRDRIDAVNERIGVTNERISSLEVRMSERLARIETLLEERLPARQ